MSDAAIVDDIDQAPSAREARRRRLRFDDRIDLDTDISSGASRRPHG